MLLWNWLLKCDYWDWEFRILLLLLIAVPPFIHLHDSILLPLRVPHLMAVQPHLRKQGVQKSLVLRLAPQQQ